MKYIGAHVSTSGGVENAPENARKSEPEHLPYLQKISDNGNRLHSQIIVSNYLNNDANH